MEWIKNTELKPKRSEEFLEDSVDVVAFDNDIQQHIIAYYSYEESIWYAHNGILLSNVEAWAYFKPYKIF